MTTAALIHETIGALALRHARVMHREDHYSLALFGMLWERLGERMLVATGLGVKHLEEKIQGTHADSLRRAHLPETKDFYADLLITKPSETERPVMMLSLDMFIDRLPITHLYEFKFLNAFPSLSRKLARADTYKLRVLGEYVRQCTGTLPHMEQFVFESTRPDKKPRTVRHLRAWFEEASFRREVDCVHISLVDSQGTIHSVPGPEQT